MKNRFVVLVLLLGVCSLGSSRVAAQSGSGSRWLADQPPERRQPQPGRSAFGEDVPEWQVRLELARVLSYDQQYDDSIKQYRKVLREQPGLTAIQLEMARVFYWSGNPSEAFDLLKAFDADDLDEEEKRMLGDLLIARGDFDPALAIFGELLAANPDDDPLRFKIAEALSWGEQYDEALREYERLLERHSEDVFLRRRYAEVLHWSGNHTEAARQLRMTLGE